MARRNYLSGATLVLGLVALTISLGMRALYGVPPPWSAEPTEQAEFTDRNRADPIEGVLTLSSGQQLVIGGAPQVPNSGPIKYSRFAELGARAAGVAAIVGLLLGVAAFRYESSRRIAATGLALCGFALVWHYLLLGIWAIGAVLLILSILRAMAS